MIRDILFTSVATEEARAELDGMLVEMDLPKLRLTANVIVTGIHAAPPIEPLGT